MGLPNNTLRSMIGGCSACCLSIDVSEAISLDGGALFTASVEVGVLESQAVNESSRTSRRFMTKIFFMSVSLMRGGSSQEQLKIATGAVVVATTVQLRSKT